MSGPSANAELTTAVARFLHLAWKTDVQRALEYLKDDCPFRIQWLGQAATAFECLPRSRQEDLRVQAARILEIVQR